MNSEILTLHGSSFPVSTRLNILETVPEEKEWLGAELIFDLDADHIEGADKMTYMEILAEVKKTHTETTGNAHG